ncbi:hypothetical protein NPIL_315751 [Nephila pilipes]|uniref:Uncharacterized protein n=1 Tax=Nephila pilipes TaxID=299642 RepID=A0A8X6N297_NEPPI|nr:hypothetical protein NPIL_315751 [Nephila pilipes]
MWSSFRQLPSGLKLGRETFIPRTLLTTPRTFGTRHSNSPSHAKRLSKGPSHVITLAPLITSCRCCRRKRFSPCPLPFVSSPRRSILEQIVFRSLLFQIRVCPESCHVRLR